jgi:long-subunit acyl-CoA synthetase (AMP-forming)
MQNFPRYIWEHLQAESGSFCFRYLDDDGQVQPYSYREWTRQIQRVAVYLREQGFEQGTRVGVVAPMSRQWMEVAFGVWMAGGCVVPVNHNLARERALRCLGRSGCEWIAVEDAKAQRWLRGQGGGLPPSMKWVLLDAESTSAGESIEALPELKEEGRSLVARGGVEDLAESVFGMQSDAPATVLFPARPGDDPHGALYNGDTFQRMLNHLMSSLTAGDDETTAIVAEPGRPSASLLAIACVLKGSPLAVSDAPEALSCQLEEFAPTRLVCGPGFLRSRTKKWREKLEQAPEFVQGGDVDETNEAGPVSGFGLESLLGQVGSSAAERLVYRPLRRSFGGALETVIVAGEVLEPKIKRIVQKSGAAVVHPFSLPECGISHLGHAEQEGDFGTEEFVPRGQPIEGYRCRIEHAEPDVQGEAGEIWITSDCLFDDYWDRTGPLGMEDGWLRTGVVGRIVDGSLVTVAESS